ncbi:MAG: hypothetical protein HY684_06400 [Chloroflexi bacterium]|nr:hypothetical protein [Chloroflexota bacterium]
MVHEADFYRFVREERLFCALLAHLLLERGPNLARFLEIINAKLPENVRRPVDQLDNVEVYLEFSFLRDQWHTLGQANDISNAAKRRRIFELISRVPGLSRFREEMFPSSIPDFNRFFVGRRGGHIKDDIVYPGQWSVASLSDNVCAKLGATSTEFGEFCRFKWSFNIKPDLVVLVPGWRPLCIEAKLESREGWYPTNAKEVKLFDDIFGSEQGRVGQIKLQRFMFEYLLGSPCQSVVIGKTLLTEPSEAPPIFLGWRDVFAQLDLDTSHPFVRRFIGANRHMQPEGH